MSLSKNFLMWWRKRWVQAVIGLFLIGLTVSIYFYFQHRLTVRFTRVEDRIEIEEKDTTFFVKEIDLLDYSPRREAFIVDLPPYLQNLPYCILQPYLVLTSFYSHRYDFSDKYCDMRIKGILAAKKMSLFQDVKFDVYISGNKYCSRSGRFEYTDKVDDRFYVEINYEDVPKEFNSICLKVIDSENDGNLISENKYDDFSWQVYTTDFFDRCSPPRDYLPDSVFTIDELERIFDDLRDSPPTVQEMNERLMYMTSEEREALEIEAREKEPMLHREYAKSLREAAELPREVVARVNGEDVLTSDIARHRAFFERQAAGMIPFKVTDEMIVSEVIKEKVLLAEARELNLFPTPQEIEEFINWQKELMNEDFKDTDSPELIKRNKNIWKAYLSGYEVTAEEFWTAIAPVEYKRDLAIRNLRNHIWEKAEQQGLITKENYDQETDWENFTEKLVSKAEVVVVNHDKFKYK